MKGNFRRQVQRSNVYWEGCLNLFIGRIYLKNHCTAFIVWHITSLAKAMGKIMTVKKVHKGTLIVDTNFKNT